jgi:hypothetical protein
MDEPGGDEARDELDPASYAYWEREGFRGRPPWRRGFRFGYFAISLGLVALVLGLLAVLRLASVL